MSGITTHLDIVRANVSQRALLQGELRELDGKLTEERRAPSEDELQIITERRAELEQIDARILANLDMEARDQEVRGGIESMLGAMVQGQTGDLVDTRSIGERFADNEEVRAYKGTGTVELTFEGVSHRAVTTATTTNQGALIVPERSTRVGQDILDRRVYLADLLPSTSISGAYQYVQDQTPLADLVSLVTEVAEAGAKPQVGITMGLVDAKIATVAAYTQFTRQSDWDAPMLRDHLDGRLRYALRRRRDQQMISGDGAGANIQGLLFRSGIATYTSAAGMEPAIAIRKAITALELLDSVPEIVVMNPLDGEKVDLVNFATAGLHAVPDIGASVGTRTAWGLTKIHHNGIPQGTALLIDPMCLLILDRMAPQAFLTDSHASNFTSNILTLLLELRMGLALFNPAGICKVTFTPAA